MLIRMLVLWALIWSVPALAAGPGDTGEDWLVVRDNAIMELNRAKVGLNAAQQRENAAKAGTSLAQEVAAVTSGCVPLPFPTTPSSSAVNYTVNNTIHTGPKSFVINLWRVTCADNPARTAVLIRYNVPSGATLFSCGGGGSYIVQNSRTYSDFDESTSASSTSFFCGYMTASTTLLLNPYASSTFDDQASFQYYYDGDQAGRVTVPAAGGSSNCGAFGTTCAAAITPTQGWWWDPTAPGSGFGIGTTGSANRLFLAWFTFDDAGRDAWPYATLTQTTTNTYTGALSRCANGQSFNSSTAKSGTCSAISVNATLTFTSANAAQLTLSNGRALNIVPFTSY